MATNILQELRERVLQLYGELGGQTKNRYNEITGRAKKTSKHLRRRIATLLALALLGVTLICSMTGLMMFSLSQDACEPINSVYFYLPPGLLLLGSLLGPLFFLFSRPLKWILLSIAGPYSLGTLLFIVWFPLLLAQC